MMRMGMEMGDDQNDPGAADIGEQLKVIMAELKPVSKLLMELMNSSETIQGMLGVLLSQKFIFFCCTSGLLI